MTDYKSILVHYDAGRRAPVRLETAIQVASEFGARVTSLYALEMRPIPSAAVEAGRILIEARSRMHADMLKAAREGYEACLRRTGYENAEWRQTAEDAVGAVTLHARYADLVVIGQHDDDWTCGVSSDFQERLPLMAGRPVLVVPHSYERRPIGRRIAIAWNASREAARAVSDALPLLKRASYVHVGVFRPSHTPGAHGEEPGADIAAYLVRHGVKVEVVRQDWSDVDVGNQLLSRAFDWQSDLIVMGAWGHSRASELLLGGVTRSLLRSMTVPVLMAH